VALLVDRHVGEVTPGGQDLGLFEVLPVDLDLDGDRGPADPADPPHHLEEIPYLDGHLKDHLTHPDGDAASVGPPHGGVGAHLVHEAHDEPAEGVAAWIGVFWKDEFQGTGFDGRLFAHALHSIRPGVSGRREAFALEGLPYTRVMSERPPAPSFRLLDQDGTVHALEDYRGRWVVLYFYPKDDTPGCTKEACSFRDEQASLKEAGAVVLGVSADDVASHQRFHRKYTLNFPLLADPESEVIRAYGAWGTRNLYGKTVEGVLRKTYLIDPEGRIARVWEKVQPEGHALEVLAALKSLQ